MTPDPRPLVGCLVADDAGGQDDVARPAAGAAEADEYPAPRRVARRGSLDRMVAR